MQVDEFPWLSDWAFSLPLIVICTVIHVIGLALIKEWVVKLSERAATERGYLARFGAAIALVALLVTLLHTAEALIWAGTYQLVGASPDWRSATRFSIGAMTTVGSAGLVLAPGWQVMGALESVNGMMLFGLTTAFMFAVIEKVWSLGSRQRRHAELRQPARTS
jgi:hypothetical protein